MHKRLAIALVLILAATTFVFAASNPQGSQELQINWSQRNNPYDALTIDAIAGNITELKITGKSQTRTWQGYVGNVSGMITLDDASNFTLYDWANAEPRGQIYAVYNRSSVNWANVSCLDYYGATTYNLTTIEVDLGLNETERDGVNETFNETDHPTIYVGSVEISDSSCWTTNLYQNDAKQDANFYEILLTDNTSGSIIYTAILEDKTPGSLTDYEGYNGVEYDFQMLVGENGHGTDTDTTPYWFYIELI